MNGEGLVPSISHRTAGIALRAGLLEEIDVENNHQRSDVRFEKRIFSAVPQMAEIRGLPDAARRGLFEDGVPSRFFCGNYSADLDLAIIRRPSSTPVVRFGSDRAGVIGVDSVSGDVLRLFSGDVDECQLVNSRIGYFTEIARILTERFPYYPDNADFDEIEEAAEGLRDAIRVVDPHALYRGNYWADLIDEIDGFIFDARHVHTWYLQHGGLFEKFCWLKGAGGYMPEAGPRWLDHAPRGNE